MSACTSPKPAAPHHVGRLQDRAVDAQSGIGVVDQRTGGEVLLEPLHPAPGAVEVLPTLEDRAQRARRDQQAVGRRTAAADQAVGALEVADRRLRVVALPGALAEGDLQGEAAVHRGPEQRGDAVDLAQAQALDERVRAGLRGCQRGGRVAGVAQQLDGIAYEAALERDLRGGAAHARAPASVAFGGEALRQRVAQEVVQPPARRLALEATDEAVHAPQAFERVGRGFVEFEPAQSRAIDVGQKRRCSERAALVRRERCQHALGEERVEAFARDQRALAGRLRRLGEEQDAGDPATGLRVHPLCGRAVEPPDEQLDCFVRRKIERLVVEHLHHATRHFVEQRSRRLVAAQDQERDIGRRFPDRRRQQPIEVTARGRVRVVDDQGRRGRYRGEECTEETAREGVETLLVLRLVRRHVGGAAPAAGQLAEVLEHRGGVAIALVRAIPERAVAARCRPASRQCRLARARAGRQPHDTALGRLVELAMQARAYEPVRRTRRGQLCQSGRGQGLPPEVSITAGLAPRQRTGVRAA